LDPEQIERLRASRDSLRQELTPQNDQLDELRGKLFEEISKDNPDREVVDKLVEQMGSVQTEIHKRVVNRLLEDGAVLKPEQRRFLLRMLEERSMQQRGPDPDHWRRMGRRGMPGNRDNMSTSKGE
jgi:Spy/CpxP family protein refolding chaperone